MFEHDLWLNLLRMRFHNQGKKTASGKLVRSRRNKQHILTKKSAKRKRRLRKDTLVSAVDAKRVKQMLPHL